MKSIGGYLDKFQIAGFFISFIISICLLISKQDTLLSLLVGLVLGIFTQLFDLQARMMASDDKTSAQVTTVINSLKGLTVTYIADDVTMYRYLAKRLREARSSVDEMTLFAVDRYRVARTVVTEARNEYLKSVYAIFSNKDVKYREIMAFPRHIDRAERFLEKQPVNCSIRYYELFMTAQDIAPPFAQFVIVDNEEIIFTIYSDPDEDQSHIAVRNPEVVEFFRKNYERMWKDAKPIKEGNEIGLDALGIIRSRLNNISKSSL